MILVTGAAGKTGRAVIRAVTEKGGTVRALVRRQQQEKTVRACGAQQVLVGDMRDGDSLRRAVQGVAAIYHIGPNMHPAELEMGRVAVEAAAAAGLSHFVYHSVLHPQTEEMPHHWRKLRVEERLFQSGLPFTILQPAAYMQNIGGNWQAIVAEGLYRVPYPTSTRLSLVHLGDVAEVAARVLLEAGHDGAIYELAGTEPLAQTEVADVLSQVLGHPVRAEVLTLQAWRRQAEEEGVAAGAIETLMRMFRYYAQYGFVGNPRVLNWLLGRRPRSLADFAREAAAGAQE